LKNDVVSSLLLVSDLKNDVSVFTDIPVLDNLHEWLLDIDELEKKLDEDEEDDEDGLQ
jgi:hypothetical protein